MDVIIPDSVMIKNLEMNTDHHFIEVGKVYKVKELFKDVGYIISTPRNEWIVSKEQVEVLTEKYQKV